MTLIRWNPFREMDEFFSSAFNRRLALPGEGGREELSLADWAPTVDIEESDEEYLIKVELPGVAKDDVKVTIDDGVLTVRGERKLEREEKNRKYHRVERAYGSFARRFVLPDDVDAKTVRAEHKDGMLNVHLGKLEETKPRSIEVKVA